MPLLIAALGVHLWPLRLISGQCTAAIDDLLLGCIPGDLKVRPLFGILLNLLQSASQWCLGKVVLEIDGPDHSLYPL